MNKNISEKVKLSVSYFFEIELAMLTYFLSPALAEGRSMDQAATSIVGVALTVAKVICVLGAVMAGIAYNVPGLEEKAQRYLKGFVMGTICTFGGPAFIRMMQSAF